MPSERAMSEPSCRFERPLNSISRLWGARSIQVEWSGSVTAGAFPGTVANSGIGVSTLTALSPSISLDVGLLGTCHSQRVGRDVVGDHRPRRSPGAVADRDRRDEDIMRAGVDVSSDRRSLLAGAVVVGGDGAGADVRVLADLGVADVGQVGHLGALSDHRVLDLDKGAGLGALEQDGARAKVAERPDRGVAPDLGVDG